jgi:hypothetical protein
MKSSLSTPVSLLLTFLFCVTTSRAQIFPNGSFENWITGNFEIPANYPYSSNPVTFYRCNEPFNVEKVSDAYHGSFALRLTTRGTGMASCFGYLINALTGDNPLAFMGGFPYNQKPTGIRGYYKSAIPPGDSAFLLLIFKSAGAPVGMYETRFYGTHSTYALFDFTFPDPLPVTPDTVIIGISSSDVFNDLAINGSMIQLDSISFKGVTTQPALMNGSFENWENHTIYKPVGPWDYSQIGERGDGMHRTTDAYAGSYALQLKSLPEINQISLEPQTAPSQISLGTRDCDGMNCWDVGGIPFNKMKDTLQFRYKYAPAVGTDKAHVVLFFKKQGSTIDARDIQLNAASVYTLIEIPFQLSQQPDTVIIQFTSGDWNNSGPEFAGAELKIDAVTFKSDINTAVNEYPYQHAVKVYPNPSKGLFVLQTDVKATRVEIMNAAGQRVYAGIMNNNRVEINLTQQPKGVYIYKLYNKDLPIARGKLLIE